MILPAKPYAPHLPGNELGLRENWRQFSLLVVVNAFGMVGLERTVVSLRPRSSSPHRELRHIKASNLISGPRSRFECTDDIAREVVEAVDR
jgi:hypothetical protein